MARYKVFGKADNDQGQLFEVPNSEGVSLRIRRIPYEMLLKFERRYGKEEMVANPATGFKAPQWQHSQDDQLSILKDTAEWAWVDSVGLEVEIGDEEGSLQWSKMLNETVAPGAVVRLDGRLTNVVKRNLFAIDLKLPRFILEKSGELSKAYDNREGRLQGN